MAASMGAWLLAAGAPGKRTALAHARIMIHQPAGGVRGQATDIDIQAQEILKLRDQMNIILASHTGQDVKKIAADTDLNSALNLPPYTPNVAQVKSAGWWE